MDISSIQQSGYIQPSQTQQPDNQTQPISQKVEIGQNNYLGGVDRSAMIFEPEKRDAITHEYSKLHSDSQIRATNLTFDMRDAYTQVQMDLYGKSPELLNKDWDFTVDQDGELIILEGEDKLSKEEMEQIKTVLEDHNIDSYMNDLADSIVNAGIGSRGPEQWANGGIGKYDITRESISEVLRGRELMHDTKMRHINKGPEEVWMARNEYNENKQSPLDAIMMQIQTRGTAKYDYNP